MGLRRFGKKIINIATWRLYLNCFVNVILVRSKSEVLGQAVITHKGGVEEVKVVELLH